MAAKTSADFLVEIGTEELPPKALRTMMLAFASGLERLLTKHRIEHGAITGLASPRRLAVIVNQLAALQDDREIAAKGPPLTIAFDAAGKATPAALAFAKKCSVSVSELGRTKTSKGEWLCWHTTETGADTASLLPGIIEEALQDLPIPRRMRWGDSAVEFVRPVHWVIMLHGKSLVAGKVLGCNSGRITRGHRFLSSGDIEIGAATEYVRTLQTRGFVLVDFSLRQQKIVDEVTAAAATAGGTVAADDGLYEEVAALTEWPVIMTGRFDEAFLELPPEAIIASLTEHQRYFPIVDAAARLLPAFVVVANLDSLDPDTVRKGNERVIRARLADASFFWQTDRKVALADRRGALQTVVYQKGLGSLHDKCSRTEALCESLAEALAVPGEDAIRAAQLAKCDLLTGMVREFPGLQGVMGGYYAKADGETGAVVTAIAEQYLPRFAGDSVPASSAGQILALADKLDTLAGAFALGQKPTGNKDPFGLRRAALGVIRILIDGSLELELLAAVGVAVRLQPVDGLDAATVAAAMFGFISERLRNFYIELAGVTPQIFNAVQGARDGASMSLPDFNQRIQAVTAFAAMPESRSLATANKRISNILQKSALHPAVDIDPSLLQQTAEIDLNAALQTALSEIAPLQEARRYADVLARLAQLKEPVDRFFDEVMVMVEDESLLRNRLALLACLREPFHRVADISQLSVIKSPNG